MLTDLPNLIFKARKTVNMNLLFDLSQNSFLDLTNMIYLVKTMNEVIFILTVGKTKTWYITGLIA